MRVLCVDDHPIILNGLRNKVLQILPNAHVEAFTRVKDALSYAQKYGCDVLLCEIELHDHGGLRLAKQIKEINPQVNIIFVTVCSEGEHAKDVMQLRPSGYLSKPASIYQLKEELLNLRYPVERQSINAAAIQYA